MKRSNGVSSPIRKNMRYCKRFPELKKPGQLEFWLRLEPTCRRIPTGTTSRHGAACVLGTTKARRRRFRARSGKEPCTYAVHWPNTDGRPLRKKTVIAETNITDSSRDEAHKERLSRLIMRC